MSMKEVIKGIEVLVREKIRMLIVSKLSIWNSKENLSDVIDQKTEEFMKVIRPALYRVQENEGLEGCGRDWYQDIVDFHREVMKDEFPTTPHIPTDRYTVLRQKLIKEETEETLKALRTGNLVGIADGIADSIVVLLGTAVTCGIDMRPVWNEVHRTNMAKKEGKLREDGKRLKPKKWKPPDIEGEIRRQQNAS